MNTIEKIYTNYDGLLEEFSEEVIQSRYAVSVSYTHLTLPTT